jgi:hypothetical protein
LFITFFALGQNKDYQKGIQAFNDTDFKKAFNLLKPFAASGDSMAEYIVGFCYFMPELGLKNDSLADKYLLSSAEKFNPKAMGLLSIYYMEKGIEDDKYKIQALVWAETAGAYDPIFNVTTTRYLIRSYLDETALNEVEKILKDRKNKFDKISLEAFYALNKQAKSSNKSSEKAKIPENTYNLIVNPYSDWVSRWKYERFECDTMYYTASIDAPILDSAINGIKQNRSFKADDSKPFTITKEEQDFLLKELDQLKTYKWSANMFPYSRCLSQNEIQATFDNREKLPTEKEKNMCATVYTFSRPIFLRNNTIALFLDQRRYRTNYTQLAFSFYKFENNQWNRMAAVYVHYESEKKQTN